MAKLRMVQITLPMAVLQTDHMVRLLSDLTAVAPEKPCNELPEEAVLLALARDMTLEVMVRRAHLGRLYKLTEKPGATVAEMREQMDQQGKELEYLDDPNYDLVKQALVRLATTCVKKLSDLENHEAFNGKEGNA